MCLIFIKCLRLLVYIAFFITIKITKYQSGEYISILLNIFYFD